MTIQDYIKKGLEIPKNLFKEYPFSISLSIIAALLIAIFLENDFLGDIFAFIFLLPVGVLFSEIFFKKKNKIKYIAFAISFIIAIIGNKYIRESNELIIRCAAVYCITLFILGLIKLFKDSKLSLNEYVTRVATNTFKVQIVSSILSTGILLIIGIIITLFKAPELLIVRAELLFMGVFVIPAMIYAVSDTKEKVWDFFKFLIKNLSSIIVIAAFFVIYIYMLKILVTLNIPSNQIFRITAILFIVGLPIWTMVTSFEKDNVLVKTCDKLPLAFIPFIALQIYSLIVRIADNGLTIIRYFGILLIILEIIYTIIYILKKEKVYYIGYVLIVMSIIGIIAPKINATDLVVNNQYRRVVNYLNKEILSPKEQSSLYSSYIYLKGFKEGNLLLNNLTKEQIEYITESRETDYNCYYSKNTSSLYNVDIKGYSKISEFTVDRYDNKVTYNDLHEVVIKDKTVDFYSYIKKFINTENEEEYLLDSNIIAKKDYKIYVNDLQVCIEDSELKSYTIGGYILEK